ncbi:neuromedin-U isoform 2-T3 [Lycaon pictus]
MLASIPGIQDDDPSRRQMLNPLGHPEQRFQKAESIDVHSTQRSQEKSQRGAPVLSQGLQPEQEPQLWNEIRDACSAFLSLDSQPQAPNALKELCITIMGTLPKPQETDEKDNTKRFLFHYSKTRKLGNSNVVEEFQGPIASQVRRQFLFRPRNGRRSEGYI